MNISSNNNLSFTSRCPDVRMAQDVCHVVQSQLPHVSSTRMLASFNRLVASLGDESLSAEKRAKRLDLAPYVNCSRIHYMDEIREDRKFYNWIAFNDFHRADNVIRQLTETKRGNCGEDAVASHVILEMNGVKSAKAHVCLNGNKIDHAVCVFNRDNSEFDGNITKDTIIIDSWLGIADFAENIFLKYKNMFREFFNLGVPEPKETFTLTKARRYRLSPKAISSLREDYPQFVLKGKYNSKT